MTSIRIPTRDKLIPVYAVIVLMVYSWTILWFNYNLPGWLGFILADVLGIFAYSMVTNFFESLAVLAGITLFSMLLPHKWFSDAFVTRGSALAILVLGLLMYVAKQFATKVYYPAELVRWFPAILAVILVIVFVLGRLAVARKIIEIFSDRAIIFLYISIPISVLSMIVILIR